MDAAATAGDFDALGRLLALASLYPERERRLVEERIFARARLLPRSRPPDPPERDLAAKTEAAERLELALRDACESCPATNRAQLGFDLALAHHRLGHEDRGAQALAAGLEALRREKNATVRAQALVRVVQSLVWDRHPAPVVLPLVDELLALAPACDTDRVDLIQRTAAQALQAYAAR